MGLFLLIAIIIGIAIAGFFLPYIAKLFIHLDYVFLIVLVWGFVFGASGSYPYGLLANHELHTVFVILIYLVALGVWFGLQQIRVFGIYIFRIIACAISAIVFVNMAIMGLFGQAIADGMDVIWQWAVGILYFAVVAALRVKDKSLMVPGHRN